MASPRSFLQIRGGSIISASIQATQGKLQSFLCLSLKIPGPHFVAFYRKRQVTKSRQDSRRGEPDSIFWRGKQKLMVFSFDYHSFLVALLSSKIQSCLKVKVRNFSESTFPFWYKEAQHHSNCFQFICSWGSRKVAKPTNGTYIISTECKYCQ